MSERVSERASERIDFEYVDHSVIVIVKEFYFWLIYFRIYRNWLKHRLGLEA